jgi:uncharacterized LabA/DUF88 family protein
MDTSKKTRVVAYIDGFNVYHAIANNLPEKYKWLNYRKFVESFLGEDDILQDIFFFTAPPRWDPERLVRHNNYLDILKKWLWIKIISGNYTSVERKFHADKMPVISPKDAIVSPRRFSYGTYEEKQTDVNLALAIFEGGILDFYDKAFILSGDSDIAPAIHRVKRHKKDKHFTCILPYKWRWKVMLSACDSWERTTVPIIESCLLPDVYHIHDREIRCPYTK